MLVEFSVLPIGNGVSLSESVAKAVSLVSRSGLPYKVTEMWTIVEGEWDEILSLIKRCHTALLEESGRVVTTMKVDDRKGRSDLLTTRLRTLEKKVGHPVKR